MTRYMHLNDTMQSRNQTQTPKFGNIQDFSFNTQREVAASIANKSLYRGIDANADQRTNGVSLYTPNVYNDANSVYSEEEIPGIDGFQIIGDAKPGSKLLGCGFPVRGTSICMFQWVRHLPDGTKQYIEGATNPEYVVTADDVDRLIAVECIPMDDYNHQGEIVMLFANDQKKITCGSQMGASGSHTKAIHDERRPDVVPQVHKWAPYIAPLIKAAYAPCFSSQLSLDLLHLSPPGNSFHGSWRIWKPGESGNTVSLAMNIGHCGLIVRDYKGTLKVAWRLKMEEDSLFHCVCKVTEVLKGQSVVFCHLQCSHPDIVFLQADTFTGHCDNFVKWKGTKQALKGITCSKISVEPNDAAVALSFCKEMNTNVRHLLSDRPIAVRKALLGRLFAAAHLVTDLSSKSNLLLVSARPAFLPSAGILSGGDHSSRPSCL